MSLLKPLAFSPLPLGSVLPCGWLLDQVQVQAAGLTGHLDEIWPDVGQSRWIGGEAEGWERGPYWLDGLVPLAFLLQDEKLIAKGRHWVDYVLAHQSEDGWLGPRGDDQKGSGESQLDPWPIFVLAKAFLQWEEATGDERIVPSLLRAARRIHELLGAEPLRSWAKMRWGDWVWCLHVLYEKTGEAWLLEAAARTQEQGFDWDDQFANKIPHGRSPVAEDDWDLNLTMHGVNNAMGVKSGGVWWRQSHNEADKNASFFALEQLERYHGQANGMFSGDEHLAGHSPVQGTETCTVVELMFSLEALLAATGDSKLADLLEIVAYNALPGSMGKDMWTRQYDQQPNQVLCTCAKRDWVSNGDKSNLFTFDGNFGCCTANLHQGWPKFAAHAWMKAQDGLALIAPLPSEMQAEIKGQKVRLRVEGDYPFRESAQVTYEGEGDVEFTLHIRVPAWADNATAKIGGEVHPLQSGTFAQISRVWKAGDVVELHFPLDVRFESRENGAVSVWRGPVLFGLQIGEEARVFGEPKAHPDFEVHPTTAWNYALASDPNGVEVENRSLSDQPFNNAAYPVVLRAKARLVPDWTMLNDSAAPPPHSPVSTTQPLETVTLVPYGSTLLRISEFPTAS